jgi:hypothetical protein
MCSGASPTSRSGLDSIQSGIDLTSRKRSLGDGPLISHMHVDHDAPRNGHAGAAPHFVSAPGRNRTCDSRFRNSMQPRLLTSENTLQWVIEQAIPSLEDSFVTRRFPVFHGTTAGPIR